MFTTEDTLYVRSRAWLGRNWKWVLGLCLVSLLLTRTRIHFGYFAEDKSRTAALITQFHKRMDAGQFDQIYDDASAGFQNSQTRDNLIQTMQRTRDEYGRFEQILSARLNVVVGAPVQVRAVYDSLFEKGEVSEWFIFVEDSSGERIQLLYYKGQLKNGPGAAFGTT